MLKHVLLVTALVGCGSVSEPDPGGPGPEGPEGPAGAAGSAGPAGAPGMDAIAPAGAVTAFAGSSIPSGWLLCDGAEVNRAQYARLFAAIGTLHGIGDGSTTFIVPDYRGLFLRGRDSGTGRDPDAAARAFAASGGATGDNVGSIQADVYGQHAHDVNDPGHNHGGATAGVSNQQSATNPGRDYTGGSGNAGLGITYTGPYASVSNRFMDHVHTISTGATGITVLERGGSETRPKNAYVQWIIKY